MNTHVLGVVERPCSMLIDRCSNIDEWLEIMTAAENMVKIRVNGTVELNAHKLDWACILTQKAGVDFMDWCNRYFDADLFL